MFKDKKYAVIDFETDDKYIGMGKGAGWVFGIPVLGMAVKFNSYENFITDNQAIIDEISKYDIIVAHNAQYEAGVMLMLGMDITKFTFVDTLLLAKMHDNRRLKYTLGDLGYDYFGTRKEEDGLAQAAIALGLIKSKVQNPIAKAKENMGLVFSRFPDVVAKYALVDVQITWKLLEKFKEVATDDQILFYSDLIKSLVLARKRGVRISTKKAEEAHHYLTSKEEEARGDLEKIAPGVNINSSKQLAVWFDEHNYSFPRTDTGRPSFTKEFFAGSDYPICKLITTARLYEKARRDFIDPVLEQSSGAEYITIHPEINIFGAAATGRASSSNPNVQQIPKRNKELKVIREMYLPLEGEKWYSLDFSSQEPRLQVHYAYLLKAPGAEVLVTGYKENSKFDLHGAVAEMSGITRDHAKTVNLGISYGMGLDKLAKTLKINIPRAKALLDKYHYAMPYLKSLDRICKMAIKQKGFIKTIGGRHLLNEPGFEYKALNKLIQGSAADQTYTSMVLAYRAGIKVMFPIHDSLEISGTKEDALKLREIMITSIPMSVPSYTDIEEGDSWGSIEKLDIPLDK